MNLGTQLETFVNQLVKAGRYNSRSEVLREGIRIIHERETRLAMIDAALKRGIDDADAGHVHELDEVARRIRAKYAVHDKPHGIQ